VSPLTIVVLIAAAASAFAWVASLASRDTSWVDRSWSIVPVVYVWVFALAAHGRDARLDVMAVLVTLWGARLTFNFARKGGYSGVEDYRWAVLRDSMTPGQFQLLNFFFVVVTQNAILVLITLPAWNAYQHRAGATYGALDAALALAFVACTIGEAVADEQQWRFQAAKRAALAAGTAPRENFLQAGLFRYARHPNYFFELVQWWFLYLLGAVAAGGALQWTIIGALALSALFVGSTRFTEQISRSKYPEYRDYQRRTSAVVPWFPRAEAGDALERAAS
jgi:steroid 5-alpha reductase family enzyme